MFSICSEQAFNIFYSVNCQFYMMRMIHSVNNCLFEVFLKKATVLITIFKPFSPRDHLKLLLLFPEIWKSIQHFPSVEKLVKNVTLQIFFKLIKYFPIWCNVNFGSVFFAFLYCLLQ